MIFPSIDLSCEADGTSVDEHAWACLRFRARLQPSMISPFETTVQSSLLRVRVHLNSVELHSVLWECGQACHMSCVCFYGEDQLEALNSKGHVVWHNTDNTSMGGITPYQMVGKSRKKRSIKGSSAPGVFRTEFERRWAWRAKTTRFTVRGRAWGLFKERLPTKKKETKRANKNRSGRCDGCILRKMQTTFSMWSSWLYLKHSETLEDIDHFVDGKNGKIFWRSASIMMIDDEAEHRKVLSLPFFY